MVSIEKHYNLKTAIIITLLLFPFTLTNAKIRVRPETWGKKVIGSELENLYKIDSNLYRSEQPDEDNFANLHYYGIKSVLNLRNFHSDNDETEDIEINLYHLQTNADELTKEQLINALKIINEAPKPILVHCWHGSDRTGAICAAYRIVFQNWQVDSALDEMLNGGYGFHSIYKNIIELLNEIDWNTVKKEFSITNK